MNNNNYFIIFILSLFSFCLCDISVDQKEKLLIALINYYNNVPHQIYTCDEGLLQNTQQVDETTYQIVANLKVKELSSVEVTKLLQCTATVQDVDNGVNVVNNYCQELRESPVATRPQELTLEVAEARKPMQLDNEIQSDTAITSEEQLIAIPRDQPIAPCVGCSSHVNPQAAGVDDLAILGIRHLNVHEPAVKHDLDRVLSVERQVINGVRYILTLSITFDNCSIVNSESCVFTKICKITMLVKPWINLPNGSKYKAILANNCTEQWQYGDNGEVLPEIPTDNNVNNHMQKNSPMKRDDANFFDNDIRLKQHNNYEIQMLQEKIIPNARFKENFASQNSESITISPNTAVSKQHVFKVESGRRNENFIPVIESGKIETTIDIKPNIKKKFITGHLMEEDPHDPKWRKLAEESLKKYIYDSRISEPLDVLRVEKVTKRLAAGWVTDIHFVAFSTQYLQTVQCHSNIWIREWMKFKQITVSCQDDNLRVKREAGLLGGLTEKDPNDLKYTKLAEESLEKYVQSSKISKPLKVARVEKVTTQVVAGSLTRIDFVASSKQDSYTAKCHSEVWEKPWENFKEIKVSCQDKNLRAKREAGLLGGLAEEDPNDLKYTKLAEESLEKYVQSSKISKPLKVARVEKVTTQVVAGWLTRIDFVASSSQDSYTVKCHSEIWEKPWENSKEIKVSCQDGNLRAKREVHIAGGLTEKDPNDLKYKILAEESLEKYVQSSKISKPLKVARVEKVTTQVVAGWLTRIDFVASSSQDSYTVKCHSEVWEKPWENFKEIKVSCQDGNLRVKREVHMLGGLTEKDPNDLRYQILAEESLEKYVQSSKISKPLKVARVEKVTTQVVAGWLTRIDFVASSSQDSYTVKCHSEIWEKPWENSKEIKVSCQDGNLRAKREVHIAGGLTEKDPNDLKYKILAEESLEKYVQSSKISKPLKVARVEKVTTQVVAGWLTRIDFVASSSQDSYTVKCHSEVWEKPWENFKEIKVSCQDGNLRVKREVHIAGGLTEKDPNDLKYKILAEESLEKYVQSSKISKPLKVARVEKVTTQVVAGWLTRIDFVASSSQDSYTVKCHSEVWEKSWENFKEIKVSCQDGNLRAKREVHIAGGLTEKDPNDLKYKKLAEESLEKYVQSSKISKPLKVARVEKVTTQVVAGSLTRIDFVASSSQDSYTVKCHSEVWEKSWENFKEIKVSCQDGNLRARREVHIAGGLTEKDPNDLKYKKLAEESLEKYVQSSKISKPLKVARVEKVSTQVVAGWLTRIDFVASSSQDSYTVKCHSEVWEKSWENFKEIKVSCQDGNLRAKREVHIAGGLTEKDPNDLKYKILAEESLEKYVQSSKISKPLKVARVEKVTTQVVAGWLTRIDFVASSSQDSYTVKCHSEVWEKPWENFKEIKVSCQDGNLRAKREVHMLGGLTEKDPNDLQYQILAEESLEKYVQSSKISKPLKVARVEKVTTQVVAGWLTRIDFVASSSQDSYTVKCHSEVWEKSWENFKEIKVSCQDGNLRAKREVHMLGGLTEKDPNDLQYQILAEESLEKYVQSSKISKPLKVARVEKVSTQVVAGWLTRIDFVASSSQDSYTVKCHSEVWEKPWENFKEIKVSCQDGNLRAKREVHMLGGLTEKDPNDLQYQILAEESLEKYVQSSKISKPLKVARVEKVTTQVVAGWLTRIDFVASSSQDSYTVKCHSEVWEKSWENFKEIKVSCQDGNLRARREVHIAGGLTEKDPNDLKYKKLAEESLEKYVQSSKISKPLKVARVEKVSTQVVAGWLTRIDFVASSSQDSYTVKCHSEVWEKSWENFKEIKVSCQDGNLRARREVHIAGGLTEKDPNDLKYKKLAEESLEKYVQSSKISKPLKVARVEKVSTQVVAGWLTRIDFVASSSQDSYTVKCHSEVWEKSWENFKEIKVSCQDGNLRAKREVHIAGGLTEKDPNDLKYKILAEESLEKYVQSSKISKSLKVARVEKVTTQVVAGWLTRIDFVASSSQDSYTVKCHSEVWEKPWENFKEIKVSCQDGNLRAKREVHMLGGLTEKDPNDLQYQILAEESLEKYVQSSKISKPLKVARVEKVTTQVVAGWLTRIDFVASSSQDSYTVKCHSEVWEKSWENFKEIKVSCQDGNLRAKREVHMLGGLTEKDPNDLQYQILAEESLEKYVQSSKISKPLKVARVEKVSTQVVAGWLTRIDFVASSSQDSYTVKCHSEVWEKPWENFKEIKVSCQDGNLRAKREVHMLGGLTEKDPNDLQYQILAEESLEKYVQSSKISKPLKVARVEKVTTQVVAGWLTRIDFVASSSQDSYTVKCHSEVWEKSWENFKEIKVSCQDGNLRAKREVHIAGGLTEKDPNDLKYKKLAEESLEKYVQSSKISKPLKVARVEKVSTQVVAGWLTRIDFVASSSQDSYTVKCHSEVWEKSWENFKEIKVSCQDGNLRAKREVHIAGGLTEKDPNDLKYKILAEESLEKYVQSSKISKPLKVARVEKVTTQVVAGSLTRIDFVASSSQDSYTVKCHSEVWEKSWENFKEIKVSCQDGNLRAKREVHIAGGLTEKDPNDLKYKKLAEESLEKYVQSSKISKPLKVARVEKVSTQVVAGWLTRIDFVASSSQDSYTVKCHSEVWEKPWENFKEIKVSCQDGNLRVKREVHIAGGLTEKDPNDLKYKILAEESLEKYVQSSKISKPLKVARVEKVTTQVVAGSLTRIDFVASSSQDSYTVKCHSEVWEKSWENFKEIKVSCQDGNLRAKREVHIAGGLTEKDPNDLKYKKLAEESLEKYVQSSKISKPLKVARVEKVSTQVVAGWLTRIDFVASSSQDSYTVKCHSEVWEKPWENFKEIKVSCQDGNLRVKREVHIAGGLSEKDLNDLKYKILAEESLEKYVQSSKISKPLKVARVEKVTTQVVAGSLTRIDFVASSSQDSYTVKCHSEVWEKPWENFKEIKVSCQDGNLRAKREVHMLGGLTEKDPNDLQYQILAEESLEKYVQSSKISKPLKVARVEKVTTQVVAGWLTRIDFVASSSQDSYTVKCHSEVWEKPWENFKEIKVSCQDGNLRAKREVHIAGGLTEKDPNDLKYKILAEESLEKYVQSSKISKPLKVARVEKVTTQVVAGWLTRIDFVASSSQDSYTVKCHSEVWEKPWENFKEIKVSCQDGNLRVKREVHIAGGLTEKDPNDLKYKILAEESLEKFVQSSKISKPLKVARVEKVTTQVVAGSLTRIDFVASSSQDSYRVKCHSEIWEKPWENFKEIKVSCQDGNLRAKREVHMLGGLTEKDPNDLQYQILAEESLEKYVQSSKISKPLKVARVEKVTTQVVAGSLTRIDFVASSSQDSYTVKCHSEVWEKPWENFKEIKVSCQDDNLRVKTGVSMPGGLTEKDPNDLKYKKLAEESLEKYVKNSKISKPLKVARVVKVTTQVVAGSLTRIDFVASSSQDSYTVKCHSEVWEKPWENFKEITVSCQDDNLEVKKKMIITLGFIEEDPNDPKYRKLAEESLEQYIYDSRISEPLEVLRVEKVNRRLAAGWVTYIDFVAFSTQHLHTLNCHSNIWIREWLKFKQITVSCQDDTLKVKREAGVFGGLTEKDPNDLKYKKLAEESLEKYVQRSKISKPLKVARVEKVTTQVVAGSLTCIDFLASSSQDSYTAKCHSEVWEKDWENFKEITVSCQDDNLRVKRDMIIAGGLEMEEDPNDPKYRKLAEESLEKYIYDSRISEPLEVLRVEKVTVTPVSGFITRIDFVASSSQDSYSAKCHSEVRERHWENYKEIIVSCQNSY